MRGKKRIALLLAASLLAGCATHPRELAPEYIPPETYADYSCAQLKAELASIGTRKAALYDSLAGIANSDIVQLILGLFIWPILLELEGFDGPDARIYQNLLGRDQAINEALMSRCPDEV